MGRPLLLLTATIDSRDCSWVVRSDPKIRLSDYKKAFRRWLTEPGISRILFCENSGSSLKEFYAVAERENDLGTPVQFFSYDSKGEGPRGKGYGELGIIAHALGEGGVRSNEMILKVSGRYSVDNAAVVISEIREIGADVMTLPLLLTGWIPTECFGATRAFLDRHFLPRRETVDDRQGRPMEHIFREAVKEAISAGLTHHTFRCQPELNGVSAAEGISWDKSHSAVQPIIFADGSIQIRRQEDIRMLTQLARGCVVVVGECFGEEHPIRQSVDALHKRLLKNLVANAYRLLLSSDEALVLKLSIEAGLTDRRNGKLDLYTGLPAPFLQQLLQLLGNRMEFYGHK